MSGGTFLTPFLFSIYSGNGTSKFKAGITKLNFAEKICREKKKKHNFFNTSHKKKM